MSTVVLLSGGLDSSTLLWHLKSEGRKCHAVTVDYGQRHATEIMRAAEIADAANVPYKLFSVNWLFRQLGGSSLTDPHIAVPHGHYTSENMRVTIVPNRNMVLLAVAGAYAVTIGATSVAYAAHAGDHPIYSDCRPAFIEAMRRALSLCSETPITLLTPFESATKADIVKKAAALGVPVPLTWSCYEGGTKHCGKCGTCIERREAFRFADIPDPTEYAND